jgi:hypothetical protein
VENGLTEEEQRVLKLAGEFRIVVHPDNRSE